MKFFKKHQLLIIVFLIFFIGRFYILKNPPLYYSDVDHDYRRYAIMWEQGETPYLKHFYEYPPATIPILYPPLWLQLQGIGDYYINYRTIIFFLDFVIFIFIYQAILKLKTSQKSKLLSLGFYLLAPVIAKDFFYEGLDLVFIGVLSLAIIFITKRTLFWSLFWLSTSIKFLTAPLLAPFFYLKKQKIFQELKSSILGFLIIWGLPLVIFRSSLAVMFVFHTRRALKYASFPSFIVETINYWTKSEVRFNQQPDFQLMGPVSNIAEKITEIVFPLSIALVLFYAFMVIFRPKIKNLVATLEQGLFIKKLSISHLDPYIFSLKISLIYIFTIFLTGKVFSQPFHIWFIPLIALFPFKSIKQQLSFIFLALWLLIIDTTPWVNLDEAKMFIDPLPWKFPIYLSRFLPMFILLFLSFKLPNKYEVQVKSK
ncbi:hypothetical protein ACFL18_00495 [Patescibacteria group bacterium]